MSTQSNPMLDVLNDLDATTDILLAALSNSDEDKAYEAISVLLLQGIETIGKDHPVMQQCFPVWDAIRNHIESLDLERAHSQTVTWKRQLGEVIEIVQNG